MKKITIALLLILSVTMVSAQTKNAEEAKKAIEKALVACQDAKKAAKPATWIALADAYLKAYELPVASLLPNTPQMEVKLFLKGQQVLSTRTEKCVEGTYTVDSYADKDLYYNENGILEFWIVTKPVVEEDMLAKAKEALAKAIEVDPKGSKMKDIAEKYETIHQKLGSDAFNYYLKGDFETASKLFKDTYQTAETPALGKVDSLMIYYCAMVANMAKNFPMAVDCYKRCAEIGFYQEGNVFSNLAEIYRQQGDTTAWKATLENGFESYPQSQGILVGLINLYRETGDNPQKLFDLLHKAQENEPDNASLFYVEGDIYKQLGDTEKATEKYLKATEINPKYVFGYLGIGIMFYEKAVELQNKANEEFDDAKYTALNNEMENSLEKSIEPFAKAFETSDDVQIKVAVAEYLKNIYFRLRAKNDSYQSLYEKYKDYMENNPQ